MPFNPLTAVPIDEGEKPIINTTSFNPAQAQPIAEKPKADSEPGVFSKILRTVTKFGPIEQFRTALYEADQMNKGNIPDIKGRKTNESIADFKERIKPDLKIRDEVMAKREKDIENQGLGRVLEVPMTMGMVAGGIAAPIETAAFVGAATLKDHIFNARRFVESNFPNASGNVKDMAEFADMIATGAIIGGGIHGVKEAFVEAPKQVQRQAIYTQLSNMNLPTNVEIAPEHISAIKKSTSLDAEGKSEVLNVLGIEENHAQASLANNIPVKVSLDKLVNLAESPYWDNTKLIIAKAEAKLADMQKTDNIVRDENGKPIEVNPEVPREALDQKMEKLPSLAKIKDAVYKRGNPEEIAKFEELVKKNELNPEEFQSLLEKNKPTEELPELRTPQQANEFGKTATPEQIESLRQKYTDLKTKGEELRLIENRSDVQDEQLLRVGEQLSRVREALSATGKPEAYKGIFTEKKAAGIRKQNIPKIPEFKGNTSTDAFAEKIKGNPVAIKALEDHVSEMKQKREVLQKEDNADTEINPAREKELGRLASQISLAGDALKKVKATVQPETIASLTEKLDKAQKGGKQEEIDAVNKEIGDFIQDQRGTKEFLERNPHEKPKIEDSQKKYYHGTDKSFKLNEIGDNKESFVSNALGNFKTERHGIFLTDNPDFAKQHGKNIIESQANPKKTIELNFDSKYEFARSIDSKTERDLFIQAKNANHIWELFDGKVGERFINYLKQKGYDSAKFKEEVLDNDNNAIEGETLVLFDKSSLSSESGQADLPGNPGQAEPPPPKKSSFLNPDQSKERGLSKSVEESAIKRELVNEFGDLPSYQTRNMDEVAGKVSEFINRDYDLAKKIALGEAPEQDGIRSQEMFTGIRLKAMQENDVSTLRDLALNEKAAAMATELGQRIKALDSGDKTDPIKAMRELQKMREERYLKQENYLMRNKKVSNYVNKIGNIIKNALSSENIPAKELARIKKEAMLKEDEGLNKHLDRLAEVIKKNLKPEKQGPTIAEIRKSFNEEVNPIIKEIKEGIKVEKQKAVEEIKAQIEKNAPTRSEWNDFLKKLEC